MSTLEIISVSIYCLIGLGILTYWWNKHSEKEREEAEKGTVGIVMLCILAFWPLKLIYNGIKKFI